MNYELLKKYEKLIYKIASKMHGEKDDLYQAGFLGLIKAYKNYNPQFDTKFSTYAFDYIYGEMYKQSNSRLIKVNKKNLKLYKNFCKVRDILTQKYERSVSVYEVCNYLKVDYHKIYSIFNSLNSFVSLDYVNCESSKVDIDNLISLKCALENLSNIEKKVFEESYFNDKNQKEVAKITGLSQPSISRLLKKSEEKLKYYVYL